MQHKRHTVVAAVNFELGLNPREGVAKTAKVLGEGLGGLGHMVGVVGLTRLDGHQGLELLLSAQVVALEPDARDHEALTFGDVDGHRNLLLVWRDRDLGGVDAKVHIATRQVVRAQLFQISVELEARVPVGLGVPAEPAACIEVEQIAQLAFLERLRADNAHFFDLGHLTLGDGKSQIDPIALDRGDGGEHLRAIEAAVDVLALEFLLGLVSQRPVEGLTLVQARLTKRLAKDVLVKLLDADEVDLCDGRALFDHHNEHRAFNFQPHVLEQAQTEQRAYGRRALFIVERLVDAQGDGRKDGSGLNPLQAFDTDLFDHERLDSQRQRAGHRGCHEQNDGP